MHSESNLCLEVIQTILSAQLYNSATQPEKGPKKPPYERVESFLVLLLHHQCEFSIVILLFSGITF